MSRMDKIEAMNEIEQVEHGLPSKSAEFYVVPNDKTRDAYDAFKARLSSDKYGALFVKGSVGAGKTQLINHLREETRQEKMVISHITLLDADEMRKSGVSAFLPHEILSKLALTENGQEMSLLESLDDPSFRAKIRRILGDQAKYNALFYNGSRHLTVIFDCITSDDEDVRAAARRWIEGSVPSPEDVDGKEGLKKLRAQGLETAAKSVQSVTTNEVLFFARDLAKELGYYPFLVIVDEIEKVADLPPKSGRGFLSGIRDLINLLYATDMEIPRQKGLFVVLSISDQYLKWAGIADQPASVNVGGREKFAKPKTDLREVPRLYSILNGIKSWADVNIRDKETMVKIGELLQDLYIKAYGNGEVKNVDVRALVDRQYRLSPELLPRAYLPMLVEEFRKSHYT